MFSIYIHIPFCLKKCGYCDFHSLAVSPDKIPQKEYVAAVCAEIDHLVKKYGLGNRRVGSIYFGGGTPTIFEPLNLELVLNAVHRCFSVANDVEITIEANPETLRLTEPRSGQALKLCNRFSIGVQSFNNRHLQSLGRIHSTDTACNAIKLVQDAGFKNINIDLMWGLPGQKIEDLELDLEKAVEFSPQHISAYQLTTDKLSNLPDEDLSREMFLLVHNKLTSAGYEHYEISSFAKKGFRCRHNENYWHYGEWLGIGSGATSFLACLRLTSTKDIVKYLQHNFTYETEEIDQKTAMAEYCFLGLRTSDGINLDDFKSRFGISFDDAYPDLWAKWQGQGLTKIPTHQHTKTLNLSGWLISNELFNSFI